MSMLEQNERAVIRNGVSTKKDWLLISSRKNKGSRVEEEDRAKKIAAGLRAHPGVVCSPLLEHDLLLVPALTVLTSQIQSCHL